MTDQESLAVAQKVLQELLEALGVERIVFVDDESSADAEKENVLVSVAELSTEELEAAIPELCGQLPGDTEVRKQRVSQFLSELESEQLRVTNEKILAAARLKNGEDTDDVADAAILHGLIPGDLFRSLTPEQWDASKEQLLEESVETRTLFLFDQDLSKRGGDPEGGVKIIASLLAKDKGGSIICGLLTHTITPENELDRWAELSAEHSISQDRFVVIPKQWLSHDPLVVAQRLKFIALQPDFSTLKEKTHEIIDSAAKIAAENIDKIRINDLDHIVFRVSVEEGIWEPDMLFRLHSLFHRIEARRLAYEGGQLESLVQKLRSVSHIPTDAKFVPPSNAWGIQKQELYETADLLNGNHLPIELGDIFEKTSGGSTKKFILLAQPCDLMIRSDGKRYPEIEHVPLVEVVSASEQPKYSEEMVYFGENATEKWFVKFKQFHQVRINLMDLCSFNSDGISVIPIEGDCDLSLRPGMLKRFIMLQKENKSLFDKLSIFNPKKGETGLVMQTKTAIKNSIEGELLKAGLFKGETIEREGSYYMGFNCKRIGRLDRTRAYGMLMIYTSNLSRPAYDRDFG